MPLRLPLTPDLPEHTFTVPLEGVQYEFRLVYRSRTASWYLDLLDEDGVALLRGQRLSPGSPLNAGLTSGPPGVLLVDGADPYARDEVALLYVTADELAALAPAAAGDDVLVVLS